MVEVKHGAAGAVREQDIRDPPVTELVREIQAGPLRDILEPVVGAGRDGGSDRAPRLGGGVARAGGLGQGGGAWQREESRQPQVDDGGAGSGAWGPVCIHREQWRLVIAVLARLDKLDCRRARSRQGCIKLATSRAFSAR